MLVQVLYEQVVRRDLNVYEDLRLEAPRRRRALPGVVCWDLLNGGLMTISAKTVILGDRGGPAGCTSARRTNAYSCTGDGMAMALRVGVPLKDMEMMPGPSDDPGAVGRADHRGAAVGEGAYLLNSEGDRS